MTTDEGVTDPIVVFHTHVSHSFIVQKRSLGKDLTAVQPLGFLELPFDAVVHACLESTGISFGDQDGRQRFLRSDAIHLIEQVSP